jgi:uncharacterized membrane protein YoaK (UPF0700 family)
LSAESAAPTVGPFERRVLLLLMFTAGVFDAVAFLGLDKVFVANMTGNVVLLGLSTVSDELNFDGPLVALLAFLAGAFLAGRWRRGSGDPLTHVRRTLFVESALLLPALVLAIGYDGEQLPRLLILAAMGASMGARNETMREIGQPEIATTAQTVRIATIAGELGRGHGLGVVGRRRLGAVVALLAGAVVGALLVVETELVWALAFLLVVHLAVGTVLWRRARAASSSGM